ncbi:uncharacterized protein LOC122509757 [Leptopilina heterotoma]|uniref:uncharacterized protein LOC122509757 n=1 Tax=Leptopilina heterotoma TaxID=63436 RepID=UPI001CA9D29A|nr:uncharacterized protein LOC122509757 [Leptopilina heterotoma]
MLPVLVILLFPVCLGLNYKVTPINTPIFQEELFDVRLYHEVWTTVHFADLRDIIEDIKQIEKHIDNLSYVCTKFEGCNHKVSIDKLYSRNNKIKDRMDTLISLNSHKRKRGIFNLGGLILRYIFGTLTEDDANVINNEITNVYNNTAGIAKLLKNQTSIIKTDIRIFEKLSVTQHKEITNLVSLVKNNTSATNVNTFNSNLMESIAGTEIALDDLVEMTTVILEAINSGKTGIVSHQLVSPQNFLSSLQVISNTLKIKAIPFPLVPQYYTMYIQLSTVQIMITDNRLTYVIRTPIPTEPLYHAFKFIPVPIASWTKYYIYENVATKPIAINIEQTDYTLIDLEKCTIINALRICEITNPIHRLAIESSCYSYLIRDKTDTECKKKYFSLLDTFILSLANGYSWYILPRNTETISIFCPNSPDRTAVITSPSIFELSPHCRGSFQTNIYLPRSHTNLTGITEYKINITFTHLETTLLQNKLLTLPTFSSRHIDFDDLKESSKTLDEMASDLGTLISSQSKLFSFWKILQWMSFSCCIKFRYNEQPTQTTISQPQINLQPTIFLRDRYSNVPVSEPSVEFCKLF